METGDFRQRNRRLFGISGLGLALAATSLLTYATNAQNFITNTLPAPVALGAVANISINGNGILSDSWNSHDPTESNNGLYNGYPGTNGNIASLNGLVDLGNKTVIGNLLLGPTAYFSYRGTITGTIYTNINLPFPDISLPTNDASGNPIIWAPAPTTIIPKTPSVHIFTNSGYFTINDTLAVEVKPGVKIVLDIMPTNWSPASLTINGGTTNSASVTLYFESGAITISGNWGGGAAANRPENLWVFGLPGVTSITIAGTFSFVGVIDAPGANLILGGAILQDIIGSVIVKNITASGHYNFHFDVSLPVIAPSPIITVQPTNQTAILSSNVTFTVTATGITPFSYLWYFNQTNLLASGPNYSSFTLTNVQLTNAGNYSVIVSNAHNSVTSSNAILTVISPATILMQPTNQIILVGSSATYSAFATGTGPLAYQWQFNGTNLPDRIITTIAGNGTNVYTGDGGAATNTGLAPLGIAVDAYGNEFIADLNNNRILKIDASGIISTVAGNGTQGFSGDGGAATNALLYFPAGIAMDGVGNLFIADTSNNRIRKVDVNGIITTVAGNGTLGYSGDGGAATNASLRYPRKVALDINGNLFIADAYNSLVRKVDVNGIITTVAGKGTPGYSGDGGAATNAMFSDPEGMAVDVSGNLFIADFLNYRIRKVDTNGVISTVVGNGAQGVSGDGGKATNATLVGPISVTTDAAGNLFIADFYGNRIRKVDTNGIITTVAGKGDMNSWYPNGGFSGDGGIATNAMMNGPNSVIVDAGGNLFISDRGNNRIRKVTSSSRQPSFLIGPVSTNNAGFYSVVVTNSAGLVASSNAALTVVLSPNSQTNIAGNTTTFMVRTFGPESLNFQWQKNGINLVDGGNISGTTSSQLTIANISSIDSADYRAIVSDMTASVTTSNATLTVDAPIAATLGGYTFTNGNIFQFQITGVTGYNYAVQTSTNLIDWLSLITNTSPFRFTETNTGDWSQRFYRAVYLP